MVSFTLLFATLAATVTASPLEAIKRGIQPGTGTHNGFFYSYWTDGRGSVDYNNGPAGSYRVSWNNVNNWVGGKGWNPGPPRVVNYNGTWNNYNVNSCMFFSFFLLPFGNLFLFLITNTGKQTSLFTAGPPTPSSSITLSRRTARTTPRPAHPNSAQLRMTAVFTTFTRRDVSTNLLSREPPLLTSTGPSVALSELAARSIPASTLTSGRSRAT